MENMKKTYHICLSAGNETLCRDTQDYIRFFNSLAVAVAETESSLIAESIMSNHVHKCVRTTCPEKLSESYRYKYSRFYNAKYRRRGRLCEKIPFIIELQGIYHELAALSYTLRNAVHHGIAPTPFAYPHCSAKAFFMKGLGLESPGTTLPDHNKRGHLPARCKCPDGWRMDTSGLILREDVIDTADVEHMFKTPRAYLYYMNRLSGEEWTKEQEKDKIQSAPVTLAAIEKGVTYQNIEQMLRHEHGKDDYRKMDDISLCELIDKVILPEIGFSSVYELPRQKKSEIAEYLLRKYRLPETQIRRCLAMV